MRRLKDGILAAICNFTEDTEVPAAFAVWTGVSTVSAAMGRDCFVDQGYFVIYPNLYIVLVAGSARCRKSTAIAIADDLIKHIIPKVNVLSQKLTAEGLIGALSGMIGHEGDTEIIPAAVGVVLVDELSTLIDKNAFKTGTIALLTSLYDAKDFEYLTRGRGRELVKNPCLSILGGSTISWIKEAIPAVSIGGGFTSRIVFVYRKMRDKLVPWPVMSSENKKRREDIIHDLNEVAKMRGSFGITPDARKMYEDEYVHFYRHSELMMDDGLDGYANRRHHMLLKMAMIASASRRDNRLIELNDMSLAINMLRKAEESMPLIIKALTSKETGDIFEAILKYMMAKKVVHKAELVRRFRHQMTSTELDIYMRSLEEEGAVRVEVDRGKVRYLFTGERGKQ